MREKDRGSEGERHRGLHWLMEKSHEYTVSREAGQEKHIYIERERETKTEGQTEKNKQKKYIYIYTHIHTCAAEPTIGIRGGVSQVNNWSK